MVSSLVFIILLIERLFPFVMGLYSMQNLEQSAKPELDTSALNNLSESTWCIILETLLFPKLGYDLVAFQYHETSQWGMY